jgi:hypothetical protein
MMMNILKNAAIRRPLLRAVINLLWILLGVILFVNFRAHTLLVDNQSADDGSYEAFEMVNVTIDKFDDEEIWEDERIRILGVAGSKHTIRVEFDDGREPVEMEFELPIKDDMYLLSVPRMVAGMDFVDVFRVQDQVRETQEEEAEEEDPFAAEF